ncbi:MAG: hypothetical protein HKO63_06140 [Acidimicrobiia bacterium]|nr:immunity 8 family protein [Acidimicrobiia bacterium]NNL97768.1 hypothetical protein [Acidimicrobiia bacterium]
MRAEVRSFHSPDVYDRAGYEPDDPEVFGFLLQISIGTDGALGEDTFDVVVCSPKWFESHLKAGEVRSTRHHLMTLQYDWPAIDKAIRGRVARCEADTWQGVAEKLGRFGHWEFEDYTPQVPDHQI